MGWASSGFEIGNVLARGTFPAARLKRPGPDPAPLPSGADPLAPRGSPIRTRVFAFTLQGNAQRALAASPSFVGPALIKRVDFSSSNTGDAATLGHFNIFYNTSPYVSASALALTTLPGGTPIFNPARAAVAAQDYANEGGLTTRGQVVNAMNVLLDYYIPDSQFFLAVVHRQPQAVAASMSGTIIVYEGVLPTDFPAILG